MPLSISRHVSNPSLIPYSGLSSPVMRYNDYQTQVGPPDNNGVRQVTERILQNWLNHSLYAGWINTAVHYAIAPRDFDRLRRFRHGGEINVHYVHISRTRGVEEPLLIEAYNTDMVTRVWLRLQYGPWKAHRKRVIAYIHKIKMIPSKFWWSMIKLKNLVYFDPGFRFLF